MLIIKKLITGSINIISTVEELNFADLINDLVDIDIFPLEPLEINELLTKLLESKKIKVSSKILDYITEKLKDGTPFYIQLFVDGLGQYAEKGVTINKLSQIKEIYQEITDKQHKEFIDLHARLQDYLTKSENNAAKKILAHLSTSEMSFDDLYPYIEKILPDKENINKLLKRLVDEFYLKKEKGKYSFVSPMLADWWKNSYNWEGQ